MIPMAISEAMSPYSIAVTPLSESSESQPAKFLAKLRNPSGPFFRIAINYDIAIRPANCHISIMMS